MPYDANKIELEILKHWEDVHAFKKSIDERSKSKPYVFYDGPPFATGLPHYGHIVASLMKDVVPRYWTMRGFRVERKWGWDCHGLPVENIIEDKLELKSKRDIEAMGVDKFNEACRSTVLTYVEEWKKTIHRMGRWVDMDHPYKTMDLSFMESVWWVFKQLWNKGLIYEGKKAMHICPRCVTPLSNFEVTQGYKDIKDLSAIAKFRVLNSEFKKKLGIDGELFILAWTTTPWTLPGNVMLAIGNNIQYVVVKCDGDYFVCAKERVGEVFKSQDKGHCNIVETFKGSELVGLHYEPLFPYFAQTQNAFCVVAGEFVSTEEGTGIVHIAPAFGEDDYRIGREHNAGWVQHVTMEGKFTADVVDFVGMEVKPKDDPTKIDIEIIKWLAHHNKLFAKEKFEHSYPHCWRCDTPLLNYATSSWFVEVTKIKEQMLKNNKVTNWVPEHIKDGRFGKWLEGARDWAISRNRFWGTPLPIWKNEDGEVVSVGSVDELRKLSKQKITKLIFVRHAESSREEQYIKSSALDKHPLTKKGEKQAKEFAQEMDEEVDAIITSPILRCRQTAELLHKKTNAEVVVDNLIAEYNSGEWEELTREELLKVESYAQYKKIKNPEEKFNHRLGTRGETRVEVIERVRKFILSVVRQYPGKTVLLVSHGGINAAIKKVLSDINTECYFEEEGIGHTTPQTFYITEQGLLFDLHKHIVDEIVLEKDGKEFKRIPEVLDCWFESGSMPYGQMHYPFENKEKFESGFPAEFIAEGQDQTRGWFYTLHVLGTALTVDKHPSIPVKKSMPAFRNVVVNGIVLAEDGKKMSKRLKNYPDPLEVLEKYGADAMRYYLVSSPVMCAESLNFSEKDVREMYNKVVNTLWNVYTFFQMFDADFTGHAKAYTDSPNVLDKWILMKLNLLVAEVTEKMDDYKLAEASRPIEGFITELSQWYVRRSRERFKGDNAVDKQHALETLRHVLLNLSKIMAPFTPFIAERIYINLGGKLDSVHLEEWPVVNKKMKDVAVINDMEQVRKIVEMGLALRAEAGIKVRQPLLQLQITNYKLPKEMYQIIADELNVKQVLNQGEIGVGWLTKEDGGLTVALDIKLTEQLKKEGLLREVIRAINQMRKEQGMTINDPVVLEYHTEDELLLNVFEEYDEEIKRQVLATQLHKEKVELEEGDQRLKEIDGKKITLSLHK